MAAEPFEPWPAHEVHVEWGAGAAAGAARRGDVVVVVDVLSFSTTLSMAVDLGAEVISLSAEEIERRGGRHQVEVDYNAHIVAKDRDDAVARFTLSPASLSKVAPGDRLILTSLNGATMVAAAAGSPALLVGSIRSASATAAAVDRLLASAPGDRVTIVAAGEHWSSVAPEQPGVRWALEDGLGAGSVAAALAGRGRTLSVEAEVAADLWASRRGRLEATLAESVSGRELITRGFSSDVALAAEIDVTDLACLGHGGVFRAEPTRF